MVRDWEIFTTWKSQFLVIDKTSADKIDTLLWEKKIYPKTFLS